VHFAYLFTGKERDAESGLDYFTSTASASRPARGCAASAQLPPSRVYCGFAPLAEDAARKVPTSIDPLLAAEYETWSPYNGTIQPLVTAVRGIAHGVHHGHHRLPA
jgi:hypothetical protein